MADEDGWVGRTLAGRYTVTRRIGSGGMSTVYAATDGQLGRNVALKLFNPGEARDDSRRRSEVDVLARLNHPNLVTMYDAHLAAGDESVPSFLVMELVDGPDLRSTLDHGPLRGPVAAQVAMDIAQGLAAMHAQGIVHRDLKPANILLAPTGLPSPTHRAKLADFGIAHLVGADRMTTVGTIIGTASYLSPEQAIGAEPGPETDVYALGLVVLEGLTGHREYPGTIVESMSARASRDPVIADGIPASWVSLLTQMTARDPDARPTAFDVAVRSQDIARDLQQWDGMPAGQAAESTMPLVAPTVAMTVGGVENTARASTPGHAVRRTHRGRLALVALAVVALLAGGVWLGGTLLSAAPSATPAQPVPAPALTDVPSSPSSSDAPAATEAAETSADPSPVSGVPASELAPADPAGAGASTGTDVPAGSDVPAAPVAPDGSGAAPGNAGAGDGGSGNNGNGGAGNGNGGAGNGNNGNGNGNGKKKG